MDNKVPSSKARIVQIIVSLDQDPATISTPKPSDENELGLILKRMSGSYDKDANFLAMTTGRKVSIEGSELIDSSVPAAGGMSPMERLRANSLHEGFDCNIHLPCHTVVPGQCYPMMVLKRKGTTMWEANAVVSPGYIRRLGLYGSREAAQKALDVLMIEEPSLVKEEVRLDEGGGLPNVIITNNPSTRRFAPRPFRSSQGVKVDLDGIVSSAGNPYANASYGGEVEVSSMSSGSDEEVPVEVANAPRNNFAPTAPLSANGKGSITRDEVSDGWIMPPCYVPSTRRFAPHRSSPLSTRRR